MKRILDATYRDRSIKDRHLEPFSTTGKRLIIYFTQRPLSKIDYDRFGFGYFLERGDSVIVFDLSHRIFPSIFESRTCSNVKATGLRRSTLLFGHMEGNWLKSNNIYEVKEQLGHSTVSVTEGYAKHKRSKISADFPTLTKEIAEVPKTLDLVVDNQLLTTSDPNR